MRVALRGAHRKAGGVGDLGEAQVEGVLQRDDGCLRRRQLGEAAAELAACLTGDECADRVAVRRLALVRDEVLETPFGLPPGLRHVLARVHDQPMEPRRELRLAAVRVEPANQLHERFLSRVGGVLGIAENVERDPLRPRRVAGAEHIEGPPVSVFGAAYENGVGQPPVVQRPGRPEVAHGWTLAAARGLHAPTLETVDGDGALTPEAVVRALRGTFGREYHHAEVAPTTQGMLPPAAAHGAVALAEHQTEGRGRRGRTWVDEPGRGLTFSIVLDPPPPVARWPELTLLAAHAVAAAIGDDATVKHPNDVIVDGRKVAGVLAEAGERVILGVGINVGRSPWPEAGYVEGCRLELLVGVLERFEQAYAEWATPRS